MASPLLTDLYGLNMAASYWRQGMIGEATFSLFVRELPPSRGFLVAAGLDDCLDHLEHVQFTTDELGYLATIVLMPPPSMPSPQCASPARFEPCPRVGWCSPTNRCSR